MGNFCCQEKQTKPKLVKQKSRRNKTSIILEEDSPSTSLEDISKDRETDSTEEVNICLANAVRCKAGMAIRQNSDVSKDAGVDDYKKLSLLGRGGFGEVYLVRRTDLKPNQSEDPKAMKLLPKQSPNFSEASVFLQKLIMGTFSSPFLVKMHDCFSDDNWEYLVMEYAPLGDLFTYTSQFKEVYTRTQAFKALGEAAVRFIAACVIGALEVLHSNGIIYRDLKLENLLIFQNGYVKLSDFGLAQKSDQILRGSAAGTIAYLAPEITHKQEYDRAIDLWSFGVLLHQMLFEEPPYNHEEIFESDTFLSRVKNDQKTRIWKAGKVSAAAKSLIQCLLLSDPKKRLGYQSLQDIRQHHFFAGFDWDRFHSLSMPSPLLLAKP